MTNLVSPHGSNKLKPLIIKDKTELEGTISASSGARRLELNSSASANVVMLGAGYFTPLDGFMDKENSLNVAKKMQTTEGFFWPIPIMNLSTLSATEFSAGEELILLDPNYPDKRPIAIQSVTSVDSLSPDELETIAENVFGTIDPNHPGVKNFMNQGTTLIAGPIKVLNYSYFPEEFPNTFDTAMGIRDKLASLKWSKVVAFQTRNPMHRAHEELCKMALESLNADGVLIHMTLGKLKEGDIPGDIRDAAIRKMVDLYFQPNTALISGFGFDMMYAGPREALLHATFRQNCGCSHLIVGRDHAGVGDYYEPFAAQEIFQNNIVQESLQIEIFAADHTAYSKKLDKVVMMRDVEDHTKDDFVLLSGTKVREMLSNNEDLPSEFARKEVADILKTYYRSK